MSFEKSKLDEILSLQGVDISTDFAWGGQVMDAACSLKKLRVDGANEYHAPLTLKDVNALKEAGSFVAATHTWEFDANRISIPEPNLSALTAMLLDKLSFHPADLDINFHKMILCGAEGNIQKADSENKCATMMVQIPVEGGFQGGELNVHGQHQAKSFDFSSNSHDTLYAAIFNADSRNEMEQIKSGWRLIMVFYMSWKTSLKNICSSRELLPFCKTLKKLRDVLEPWEQSVKPRLLSTLKMDYLSQSYENPSTSNHSATEHLIGKFPVLEMNTLVDLVLKMRASRESPLDPSALGFYGRLCGHLLTRNFDSHGGFECENGITLEFLKCYISSGDSSLIQSFTEKLKSKNELASILLSQDFRDTFISTPVGKRIFVDLVDGEIAKLESKVEEPTFSWKQNPGQIFARHPLVQAFFYSDKAYFKYVHFPSIELARGFAMEFFHGEVSINGYSAQCTEGGRAPAAHVEIWKTPQYFQFCVSQCRKFRDQLTKLVEIKAQLLAPEPGPAAKRPRTENQQ